MAIADELKEQLEPALLGKAGVTTRNMMGTTAFLVRGRMFAFWMAEGIVVKAPRDGHADLIEKLRSAPFKGPQGGGFGEWMSVPVTTENIEDVKRAIDGAYKYVAGGANAAARRKRKR
jgi:TfoX/Sxy family transcriptional regulator of competence genes